MILRIGNNRIKTHPNSPAIIKKHNTKGFTFVEVMVTMVIFSLGIVTILKTFVVSLDQMSHLTTRLYANTLLDTQFSTIQKMLTQYSVLPMELEKSNEIQVGSRIVDFKETMSFTEVDDYLDVFELELKIKWNVGKKKYEISRIGYVSDFKPL